MNSSSSTLLVAAAVVILIIIIAPVYAMNARKSKYLSVETFVARWKEVEKLCRSATTWPLAVLDADKLLEDALKKRHCKGKTMGERLVYAQRKLSDNDSVWYGHKLRNRIAHEDMGTLKRKDVQLALRGFRQALKDLGALK